MKWLLVDNWHLKCEKFSIAKHGKPETVPLPYSLWFAGKLVSHFATSQEAKAEAEAITAGQI